MNFTRRVGLALLAAVAACAAAPTGITLPDWSPRHESPATTPTGQDVDPLLVAYPGRDVSRVSNVEDEIYVFDGLYYCFLKGHWFRSTSMKGPWVVVEMKDVPPDLFSVRGHMPPGIETRSSERY